MMTVTYLAAIDQTRDTLAGAEPRAASSAAPERGTEFRPVEGGDTVASGETLLIEAYAVLWAILFAFLWLSWRRQARVDARIGELEQALASVRKNQAT